VLAESNQRMGGVGYGPGVTRDGPVRQINPYLTVSLSVMSDTSLNVATF
jgi:hypothetical protein